MQKDREFPPDGHVALTLQIFGARTNDHPIALANGQAKQPIPNCAADQVDFHMHMVSHLRILLFVLFLAPLSGCGTLYLAQAAGGQYHVLHARKPIDKVVLDPRTPPDVRTRLMDVRAARDFAVTDLHLPDNRSYRTYADIGRPFVVWNVVAAPEFSIEPKQWCFPITGCVAYRGYFKEKKARAFAAGLAKQGYDVTVGGVPAYSTLGKFADPVMSSMMRYGDGELAGIIFHELAHQLLYVKNDSEFNEAFATTVEDVGLERWLTARGHPDLMREFLEEHAKERAFVDLFAQTRKKLAQLYASNMPEAQMRAKKAAIFAQLTQQARDLQRQQGNRYYEPWLKEGLNNAHLASIATYYQCVPGFQRLLAEQGGDLVRFYAAARALSKQPRAVRHTQLCQPAPQEDR
jgi:predicted aminopeptidase